MIDERYIEAARNLRKQYATVSSELDNEKITVDKLKEFLLSKHNEIEEMRNGELPKIKTKEQLEPFLRKILSKVEEIESLQELSSVRIKELTQRMDNLKLEELELREVLKTKYPKMSIDEIKKEIHSRL